MLQPAIASLLHALSVDPEHAREAVAPALEALSSERQELERRAATILQRSPGGPLLREARDACADAHARVTTLQSSGAPSPEDIGGLQESCERLEAALERLEQFERAWPRESPLPVVEAFILRAINHRDGFLPADEVEAAIPELAEHVEALAADARRFRALHPDSPALAGRYESELRKLQAGVNALRGWASQKEADDPRLLDALRLLKSGSVGIMAPLQEMDSDVRANARFTHVVAVEELLRAADGLRAGTASDDVFARAVDQLQQTVDFYVGASRDAHVLPLSFAVRTEAAELGEHASALAAAACAWSERARANPRAACGEQEALEQLRQSAEATALAHERIHQEIGALLESLGESPQLLEAVASLGRVASGTALPDQARRRCEALLENHQRVQLDISSQPPGTEMFEARALLAAQADAIADMEAYLDDRDERHLREGLETLRAVTPKLNAMQRDLRGAADEQRRARERVVSCFRCGTANASTDRYCKSCNAVLPVQAPEETVYTDIVGGEEEMPVPANLRRLQTIYALAESGGDSEAVVGQLETFHAELQRVARDYADGFKASSAQLTGVAVEYASAFTQQLALLIEAVETMLAGAQHGSLETMQRGLMAGLMAGEEMQGVQQHMQENVAP